jgi:hypothetical protein
MVGEGQGHHAPGCRGLSHFGVAAGAIGVAGVRVKIKFYYHVTRTKTELYLKGLIIAAQREFEVNPVGIK